MYWHYSSLHSEFFPQNTTNWTSLGWQTVEQSFLVLGSSQQGTGDRLYKCFIPLTLDSNRVLDGPDVRDQQGISAYFVQMGQFIDHDITLSPEIVDPETGELAVSVPLTCDTFPLLNSLLKLRNVARKIETENHIYFQMSLTTLICVHQFRHE